MSSLSIHSQSSRNFAVALESSIELRISHLASKLKETSASSCLNVMFPRLFHHKNADGVEFHVYNTLEAAAAPFNEKYLTARLSNIEHFGFENAFAILTNCIHLARFSGNMDTVSFLQDRLRDLMAAHAKESLSIQPEQLAFKPELVNPEYRSVLDKAHATRAKLEHNRYFYLGCTALAGTVVGLAWWMSQKYAGQWNMPVELPKTDPVKPVSPSVPAKLYHSDSYQVGQKASALRNHQEVDSYTSGLLPGPRPLTDKDGYAEWAAFGNKQNTPPQSTKTVKQPKMESPQNNEANLIDFLALVPTPVSAEEIDEGQCLANLKELQCSVNERPVLANNPMQMVVHQKTPSLNPISFSSKDIQLLLNPNPSAFSPSLANTMALGSGALIPVSSKSSPGSGSTSTPSAEITQFPNKPLPNKSSSNFIPLKSSEKSSELPPLRPIRETELCFGRNDQQGSYENGIKTSLLNQYESAKKSLKKKDINELDLGDNTEPYYPISYQVGLTHRSTIRNNLGIDSYTSRFTNTFLESNSPIPTLFDTKSENSQKIMPHQFEDDGYIISKISPHAFLTNSSFQETCDVHSQNYSSTRLRQEASKNSEETSDGANSENSLPTSSILLVPPLDKPDHSPLSSDPLEEIQVPVSSLTENQMLENLKTHGVDAFKSIDATFANDPSFMLKAVRINGLALRYGSQAIKLNQDIVLEALKNNFDAIDYVGSLLTDYPFNTPTEPFLLKLLEQIYENPDKLLKVISFNSGIIAWIHPDYLNDKAFMIEALKVSSAQRMGAYWIIIKLRARGISLHEDKEVALAAINAANDDADVGHLPEPMRKYPEVIAICKTKFGIENC